MAKNIKEVYIGGEMRGINFNLIQKEYEKAVRRVYNSNDDKLFYVDYKGYSINALPFILRGSAFYEHDYHENLCVLVAAYASTLKPVKIDSLRHVEGLDYEVLRSLLPGYRDDGVCDLGVYLYSTHPRELATLIFQTLNGELYDLVIDKTTKNLNFNYKDICNTQAFCYYIGLKWVLKICPVIKMILGVVLNRSGLDSLLDKFMPENCIHFKYIKGEITSTELFNEYWKRGRFVDGSSVAEREMICLTTNGEYDGRDLTYIERLSASDALNILTSDLEFKFNTHVAYCVLYNGAFDNLQTELGNTKSEVDIASEELAKLENRYKITLKTNSELNDKISEQDKELIELRKKVSEFRNDKELKIHILELEDELRRKSGEIDSLFNERISLKQTISAQLKQLRHTEHVNTDEEVVLCEPEEHLSLETVVDFLKDKRIAIIGGLHLGSVEDKLKSLGLKYVRQYEECNKGVGSFDIGVVLSTVVKHADVYKFEKLCKKYNTKIIYFTGTNIERIVFEIYNEVS